MPSPQWIIENWFLLLSAAGIVGGFILNSYAIHSDTKTRKVANNLKLTEGHRDVWLTVIHEPHLKRILDPKVDPVAVPITEEERIFVNLAILHSSVAFQAARKKLLIPPQGVAMDVSRFYSLPIPAFVWNEIKSMQDPDFVTFVDSCQK